jgi:hypothetical protein
MLRTRVLMLRQSIVHRYRAFGVRQSSGEDMHIFCMRHQVIR